MPLRVALQGLSFVLLGMRAQAFARVSHSSALSHNPLILGLKLVNIGRSPVPVLDTSNVVAGALPPCAECEAFFASVEACLWEDDVKRVFGRCLCELGMAFGCGCLCFLGFSLVCAVVLGDVFVGDFWDAAGRYL